MDDAERWSRIEQLFDDAIDLDAEERGAFLDRACTDPALRAEVEKLLQAAQASSDFLESPADTAARLAPGANAIGRPEEATRRRIFCRENGSP